jgi:hypothetical protein
MEEQPKNMSDYSIKNMEWFDGIYYCEQCKAGFHPAQLMNHLDIWHKKFTIVKELTVIE